MQKLYKSISSVYDLSVTIGTIYLERPSCHSLFGCTIVCLLLSIVQVLPVDLYTLYNTFITLVSVCERVEFNKAYNLIPYGSGGNFPIQLAHGRQNRRLDLF